MHVGRQAGDLRSAALAGEGDGRSAGANLTISICSQDGAVLGRVIVNNMGRPRSERGDGRPCPN